MNFAFVPLGTGSEVSKRTEKQVSGWYTQNGADSCKSCPTRSTAELVFYPKFVFLAKS